MLLKVQMLISSKSAYPVYSRPADEYLSMVDAGHAGPGHPKRYYMFGLIDPLDNPRATFRWYYRSWGMCNFLKTSMNIELILNNR